MENNVKFVDAGALLSFINPTLQLEQTIQNQDDVLNSTLLAQLASDKKYSRFSKSKDWYNFYTEIMGNCGWTTILFKIEDYCVDKKTFTLEDIVIYNLENLVQKKKIDETVMSVAKEVINTFSNLSKDDKRVDVYNSFTNSESINKSNAVSKELSNLPENLELGDLRTVHIQINVINQSLELVTVGIMLTTKQKIGENLFAQTFSTPLVKDSIINSVYNATLNESIYNKIRLEVIKKLDEKRERFILELI